MVYASHNISQSLTTCRKVSQGAPFGEGAQIFPSAQCQVLQRAGNTVSERNRGDVRFGTQVHTSFGITELVVRWHSQLHSHSIAQSAVLLQRLSSLSTGCCTISELDNQVPADAAYMRTGYRLPESNRRCNLSWLPAHWLRIQTASTARSLVASWAIGAHLLLNHLMHKEVTVVAHVRITDEPRPEL